MIIVLVCIIIQIICIVAVWLLSATTYLPSMNDIFAVIFVLAPIGVSASTLLFVKSKERRKALLFVAITFVAIIAAFLHNQNRFIKLESSYNYPDTTFNIASRDVMPVLEDQDSATEVEHYHGLNLSGEWLISEIHVPEVKFDDELALIKSSYSLYPKGRVPNPVYCPSQTPFQYGDYEWYIIDIGATTNCGAAIGVNQQDSSFVYLYIESTDFEYMSFELVVEKYIES